MKKEIIEQLQSELSKAKDTIAKIEKTIESEKKKDERLWNVGDICDLTYSQSLLKIEMLRVVADYCNELDEREPLPFTKTFMKYCPAWNPQYEKVVTDCIVLFLATPYFHSEETLNKLIKINPDFFESLLKPEEE